MDFFGILYDMKNGKKMPYSKNYFDTLFAAKLEELGVKTITDTLPIEFTSKGGAIHWTVYGKAPHDDTITGTLPLTFTAKAGAASDWEIYGNDENGTEQLFPFADIDFRYNYGQTDLHVWSDSGNLFMQGIVSETSTTTQTWKDNLSFTLPAGTYACNTIVTSQYGFTIGRYIKKKSDNSNILGADSTSFTIAEETEVYLSFYIYKATISTATQITVTLVKGSTAPDHFIPYQKGVGEKTENLFDKTTATQYRMINSSTGEVVSSFYSRYATDWIDIEQSDTISISNTAVESGAFYDSSKQYISGIYSYGANKSVPSGAQYVRLTVIRDDLGYFMLVKGSTAPQTYIPYGYQIPLIVSQTGQPDKTVDIFIGDSPLTEGETVSKTSTGVDLELFEGENTVSTTLYNKPETSITYTDYLGVGEYVNGQWQIPLTISHITDNLFDKNAHDTANGFIDNKKVYWDGLKQYSTINDNNYFLSEYMPVTAGKGYYPTDIYYYDALKEYYSIFFYTADKQLIDVAYRSHETVTPAPENAVYMRVCVAKNKADSAMMTTKPTSEYIPHKQSIDYTIPIDAPLTEGQSVSDTVEITAYEGTNTLDTTLYNKPTMTITYK